MTFGEKLRYIRKKYKFVDEQSPTQKEYMLSQARLAKELGISVKTLQSYENGDTYPSLKLAVKISETLNVPLDYLFFERNDQGILTDPDDKRYDELASCFFKADGRIVDLALMFMDFLESRYNPERGEAAE